MRKFKYLKLFEAFISNNISKTLDYIKDSHKNIFEQKLVAVLDQIDFPASKISDEFIEYLPYKKALNRVHVIDDQPCDATSEEAFPEFAVEGEVCDNDGKIKRKWGKSIRKVVCPICGGTNVKKDNDNSVKLVKFWFNANGELSGMSGVDGKKHSGESRDINLDDYRKVGEIKGDDILKLTNGDIIYNSDEDQIYEIKRRGKKVYAVKGYYFREEIRIDDNIDTFKVELLKPKEPMLFYNIPINEYLGINRYNDIKSILKNSDFAIVLDLHKLKEQGFTDKQDIQNNRRDSRKNATSLMSDDDIRNINIENYMSKLSNDVISDINNINKILNRGFNNKYILYAIKDDSNMRLFRSLISNYFDFFQLDDVNDKYRYSTRLESISNELNESINNSIVINEIINNVKEGIEPDKKYLIDLIDKFNDLSSFTNKKLLKRELKDIYDLEILYQNFQTIQSIIESDRYNIRKLRMVTYDIYRGTKSSIKRYLTDTAINDMNSISYREYQIYIKEIDRLKEVIKRV